jgi:hypothetical protein
VAQLSSGIMCAPASNSDRTAKWLLLTADAFALLGCLFGLAWSLSYRFYSKNHISWASNDVCVRLIWVCEQWLRPMFWSFVGALLVLLLISPFFMRCSLRQLAIKSWVIGALAFFCVGLLLIFSW